MFFSVVTISVGALLGWFTWDLLQMPRRRSAIFVHLVFHQEAYGDEIRRSSGGVLGRGSVYVHLGKMEDEGLLESRVTPSQRRLYRLTAAGRRDAVKAIQRL